MSRTRSTAGRTLRKAGFGAALAAAFSSLPPSRPLEADPFVLLLLAGLIAMAVESLLDDELKSYGVALLTGAALLGALAGATLRVVRQPLPHPVLFVALVLLGMASMVPELRRPPRRRSGTATTSPERITIGGRWELLRPLPGADRGGFSDPWLGADLNHGGRPVVVKLESGVPERRHESRRRLEREYRVLSAIQSRYVVAVLDGGRDAHSSRQYVVLIHHPTGSLARRLEQSQELPLSWVIETIVGILCALTVLHEELPHPIVHRDLTPRNILLRAGRTPVLCDFGSARLLRRSDSVVADERITGGVVYSQYYAPPELADQGLRDRWDPTPASDVYSVGSILYELLTGRPPYWREQRETQLEFGRLLLDPHLKPLPPAWVNADLPPALDELLARTLAFHPSDRPKSARQLLSELRASGSTDLQIPFAELRSARIPVDLGATTTMREL
jgi:serine/threonine-protein kinase